MKIKLRLSHLVVAGLLAAGPAVAFAQQPTTPAAAAQPEAAKSGVRTYTGGRHHEEAAATVVPTSGKSISSKGVKKAEAPPAAIAVAPSAEAGKSINEKGIK